MRCEVICGGKSAGTHDFAEPPKPGAKINMGGVVMTVEQVIHFSEARCTVLCCQVETPKPPVAPEPTPEPEAKTEDVVLDEEPTETDPEASEEAESEPEERPSDPIRRGRRRG